MHYIKDIFEGKKTDHAHNKFVRYSKGNFIGPLLKIKIQKAGIKLAASFHFVDELLELAAEVLGDKIVHIKGTLIWNKDLSDELERLGIKYIKVSKSRGIFKYSLDNDVNLKEFINSFNNYFILITVKTDGFSLVTKSAFPKPNKEFGADFCKVIFPIEMKNEILSEFAFDIDDTTKIKDIEIKHEIDIDEIIVPETDDFEKARRLATRKGEVRRKIYINKNEEPIITKIKINV